MKREEFPTFLNESPTIIFGRTGRELLIITIGLGFGYLLWLRLGVFIAGNVIISDVVKGIFAVIILIGALIVAFMKVATRPLEEWALAWVFYIIIPKVYLYRPAEETVYIERAMEEEKKRASVKPASHDEEDDDF
jgi:hypothetical protein